MERPRYRDASLKCVAHKSYAPALDGGLTALDGLTALQQLYLAYNGLTGTIPALDGLNALQYLILYNNGLTGTCLLYTSPSPRD